MTAGDRRIVTPSQNHGEWARLLRARAGELVAKAGAVVRHPRACAAVLVALAAHAAMDGTCYPSHESLARATSYSTRHVQRALDQAEAAGLLTRRVPGYGSRVLGATTRYALPWWAVAARDGLVGLGRVQRELPVATDAQSAAVARALREARPGALLGAVVRELPSEVAVAVLRAGCEVMLPRRPTAAPRVPSPATVRAQLADAAALRAIAAEVEGLPGASEQTTPRPDETSQKEPSRDLAPSDRGRARAPQLAALQIQHLGERLQSLVRARDRA